MTWIHLGLDGFLKVKYITLHCNTIDESSTFRSTNKELHSSVEFLGNPASEGHS